MSSTSFSAGSARQFQANAANDFITLATEVPYAGEYNVRVGVRKKRVHHSEFVVDHLSVAEVAQVEAYLCAAVGDAMKQCYPRVLLLA